jgi:predicted NACHT family NTPase
LTAIEVEQGILVERSRDTYSFSHLTFQEYLTAKWIAENLSIDLEAQRVALTPKRTLVEDLKAINPKFVCPEIYWQKSY